MRGMSPTAAGGRRPRDSGSPHMRARRGGWVAVFAGSALAGAASLASGAPPSATISTQGIVAFGDGSTGSNRGTYSMNPDGTGLLKLNDTIYPGDVARGITPITVLVNGGPSGAVGDLYAQRADGSAAPVPLIVSSTTETQARFDAGATRIAYATVLTDPTVVWTISVADVVRNGSGDVSGIANAQVVWSGGQVRGLDFSRDGSKIVFALGAPGYDLFALHLDDSAVEQLTNTPTLVEEFPRWSPSDDRIAYHRKDSFATSIASLLTIDYGTRAVVTVLAGASKQYATMPVWSPGATHLLALTGGNNKPLDLWQYPSTGGKGTNVTGSIGVTPNTPCWGW